MSSLLRPDSAPRLAGPGNARADLSPNYRRLVVALAYIDSLPVCDSDDLSPRHELSQAEWAVLTGLVAGQEPASIQITLGCSRWTLNRLLRTLQEAVMARTPYLIIPQAFRLGLLSGVEEALLGSRPLEDPCLIDQLIALVNAQAGPARPVTLANSYLRVLSRAPATSMLRPGEFAVLRLAKQGFRRKEIARQLRLSRWTVDDHFKRIYRKLGVHSLPEALDAAERSGYAEATPSFWQSEDNNSPSSADREFSNLPVHQRCKKTPDPGIDSGA